MNDHEYARPTMRTATRQVTAHGPAGKTEHEAAQAAIAVIATAELSFRSLADQATAEVQPEPEQYQQERTRTRSNYP